VNSHRKVKFEHFVKASVQLAKDAAEGQNVLIAGSNAPAEDCYQVERTISKKELEYNHKQHIDELMKNGCDFVLNETQSHFDEIKIICDYCYKQNIPFILSLLVTNKMELLSGENILDVIKFVIDRNPLSIGFNCISPNVFKSLIQRLKLNFNWGMYLNLGLGNYRSRKLVAAISPDGYADFIRQYLVKKPSFIGGCCGSNPNHIKKIKVMLDGNISN
jgi:S-methylmethionine-dependent homocysteine/selenocysteine methylase